MFMTNYRYKWPLITCTCISNEFVFLWHFISGNLFTVIIHFTTLVKSTVHVHTIHQTYFCDTCNIILVGFMQKQPCRFSCMHYQDKKRQSCMNITHGIWRVGLLSWWLRTSWTNRNVGKATHQQCSNNLLLNNSTRLHAYPVSLRAGQRTGDWPLTLKSVEEIFPLFFAFALVKQTMHVGRQSSWKIWHVFLRSIRVWECFQSWVKQKGQSWTSKIISCWTE